MVKTSQKIRPRPNPRDIILTKETRKILRRGKVQIADISPVIVRVNLLRSVSSVTSARQPHCTHNMSDCGRLKYMNKLSSQSGFNIFKDYNSKEFNDLIQDLVSKALRGNRKVSRSSKKIPKRETKW